MVVAPIFLSQYLDMALYAMAEKDRTKRQTRKMRKTCLMSMTRLGASCTCPRTLSLSLWQTDFFLLFRVFTIGVVQTEPSTVLHGTR